MLLFAKTNAPPRPRRGRRSAQTLFLTLALGSALAASNAFGQNAPTEAQLALRCALLGGDLSEPGEILAYRRCLAAAHAQAVQQGGGGPQAAPSPAPRAPITAPLQDLVGPAQRLTAPARCRPGFVWREAGPTDAICAPPASRDQAAADNAAARARIDPANPGRCLQGFVWREAFAGDHVCVAPGVRAQAAADNAQGSARVAPAF
jgi:hypothetical protein